LGKSPEVLSCVESARGQLPACNGLELAEFALFVDLLQREHGFEPSKALLDDLAAALVSLLQREPWLHTRSAVVGVLKYLAQSGCLLSVSLHDQVVGELLRSAAGTAAAEPSNSTGSALTASQAEAISNSWRALATQPWSPARATLPAVLRAVGGSPEAPILGSVQRPCGAGAASKPTRAILHQLCSAQSVEDVARVHDAAGEHFGREHVCAAIQRLAVLCPSRCAAWCACMLAVAAAMLLCVQALGVACRHVRAAHAEAERARAFALLQGLREAFERRLPECSAGELAATARHLSRLGLLKHGALKRVAVWFEHRLARADTRSDLQCVADILMLYRHAPPLRPGPALLAAIGACLSAALASGEGEAAAGAGAAKWLVPVSPDCAIDIIVAWTSVCEGAALPVTVVRALADTAVASAAAPDAAGIIAVGSLASALHAIARVVDIAPRAVPATDSESPMAGLQADVAMWAGLVIERVHLARPHAARDLGWALYALDVLEVAPDAGTAAAAVAKAAALAPTVDARNLRSFLFTLARPLAAWHRSGLVSCEPAARALCARAPELLKQEGSETERGKVLARLRMLAPTALVNVPELAEPSRASEP